MTRRPVVDDASPSAPKLEGSLDIEAVKAHASRVLDDAACWFPVRHHSPTAALHLRRALLERRPKVLFLEAPADANHLVTHIVDEKTKPPVALYVSYRDDDNVTGLAGVASPSVDVPPRFSSWFPFVSYSPEYVAMKTCQEIGCEVVFFDLPRSALIEQHEKGDEEESIDEEEVVAGDDAEGDVVEGDVVEGDGGRGQNWEGLVSRSSFYQSLKDAAGYRTWDECWDALFEDPSRHASWDSYRRDLGAFCAAVRATTPASRVATDGTLERERFMWKTFNDVKAARGVDDKDVFVVCGGFHLFLDRDDDTPPPERRPGTHYATVAPYSYFRVSTASGYGAANRAPWWYARLYDACVKGADDAAQVEAMLLHVVAVLARGRKESDGLSSADAIAVAQHARMLASLRGRRHPGLDDIRDALLSCCCKGRPDEEGAQLLKAMNHAEVGTAVGRVTPALGQLPLVHDFYAQLDDLDLGEVMGTDTGKGKRLEVALDLRKDDDQRRSVLLHRLTHLGVPLGKAVETPKSQATLFAERWALSWSPKIEDALIEKNLYGDSIEAAAVSLLEEELAGDDTHAGRACERLLRSLNMQLPGMWTRLEGACGDAIDVDGRFDSLADAVVALLLLHRHAGRGVLAERALQALLERAYGRACFLIPDVANVGEDEHGAVLRGLQALAEALLGTFADGLDKDVFVTNLKAALSSSTTPFLRGAFQGLLVEIRAVPGDELAASVSAFARARPDVLVQAGPFLDGVMAVSKTSIMLGASSLVAAVDELLRAADDDAFKTLLPQVRHAFERLHERQRDSLGGHVAERYGLKDSDDVRRIETSSDALVHMARIDKHVARVMQEWSL